VGGTANATKFTVLGGKPDIFSPIHCHVVQLETLKTVNIKMIVAVLLEYFDLKDLS